jgi:hypothetical protein
MVLVILQGFARRPSGIIAGRGMIKGGSGRLINQNGILGGIIGDIRGVAVRLAQCHTDGIKTAKVGGLAREVPAAKVLPQKTKKLRGKVSEVSGTPVARNTHVAPAADRNLRLRQNPKKSNIRRQKLPRNLSRLRNQRKPSPSSGGTHLNQKKVTSRMTVPI